MFDAYFFLIKIYINISIVFSKYEIYNMTWHAIHIIIYLNTHQIIFNSLFYYGHEKCNLKAIFSNIAATYLLNVGLNINLYF